VPERVRVQREGAQLQAQGKWSAGEGDNKQRFLADLRSLRDMMALEFDELAARAHYPSDVLKEAESGPSLPTLPILAAYVRACEGDVPEWEERWRRLGAETDADPGLPVRAAGASPAAVAGARAGVSVAPPDAYDPERIRAALRGSHGRSVQGARGTARGTAAASRQDIPGPAATEPRVPESPVSWNAGTNWDQTTAWDASRGSETAADWGTGFQPDPGPQPTTSWDGFRPQPTTSWTGFQPDEGTHWDGLATDLSDPSANGNHHVSEADDATSDTAVIQAPDAAQADALRRDPFSADWLQEAGLTSPPEAGLTSPPEAGLTSPPEAGLTSPPEAEWQEAESPSGAQDTWFTTRERADRERTWSDADAEPSPAAPDDWFTPREPAADGLTSAEPDPEGYAGSATTQVTGFWTPSAATSVPASGPAVQRADPASPPSARDRTIPRAEWPGIAETPASEAPASGVSAADRTMPVAVREAAAASAPVLGQTAGAASAPALGQAPRPASALALGQAPGAASARTIAGPAVPPGPVVRPSASRSDRIFMVRLLVIIVVAALIGSVLVLLVR
jgi:hypothetical protein